MRYSIGYVLKHLHYWLSLFSREDAENMAFVFYKRAAFTRQNLIIVQQHIVPFIFCHTNSNNKICLSNCNNKKTYSVVASRRWRLREFNIMWMNKPRRIFKPVRVALASIRKSSVLHLKYIFVSLYNNVCTLAFCWHFYLREKRRADVQTIIIKAYLSAGESCTVRVCACMWLYV